MDVNGVLILIGEIVAHSPLGEDEFRLGGVALDLFTQPADMHIHRARVAGVIVLPYGFQQGLAADLLAAVVDKYLLLV